MGAARFAPSAFKYNLEAACALVPSILIAASFGGKLVMSILAIGLMLAYTMDTLQYREGSLAATWGSLVLANLALIYTFALSGADRPIAITMFAIFTTGTLCAVVGMWATLQFKWVQARYPPVVITFERHVLTASIPLAAIVQTLGIATLVETQYVPFYVAAILTGLYHILGRPLTSSFQMAPSGAVAQRKVAADQVVQGKLDGFLLAVLTCALPSCQYVAMHSIKHLKWLDVWSVTLLWSVPLLYICLIQDGLWWLPGAPGSGQHAIRLVLLVVSLCGGLLAFEGRVIFHSYSQYIMLHPPLSYAAVTLALAGFAALVVAHVSGALRTWLDPVFAGSLLLVGTFTASLAAGVPIYWIPAPLLATASLILYLDTGSMREYLVFTGAALATGIWFVAQHFWFLDIAFGEAGIHIQLLCRLMLIALVPAVLVPGLVLAKAPTVVVGGMLLGQASLVCFLEEQLYLAGSQEAFEGESMYPAYLVMATSLMGIAAARHLCRHHHIGGATMWLLCCLYAAKLAILALPEALLVLPTALLLLAATSPLFLHAQESPRQMLQPWQGLLHVLIVCTAALLARFAVFDIVQWLLRRRPSAGLLLGVLVLVNVAAVQPLVWKFYKNSQLVRRKMLAAAAVGVLLCVLQPPVPIRGGAACPRLPLSLCPRLWDERHVPSKDVDDAAIWATGVSRRSHWPEWLLFAAVLLALVPSMKPQKAQFRPGKLLLFSLSGLFVGSYIALEVAPGQPLLQPLLVFTTMLVVAFLALLQMPSRAASSLMPVLAVAWAVVCVLTLIMHSLLPPSEHAQITRIFPDDFTVVEAAQAAGAKALLLGLFAAHSLILAFSLKLKISASLHRQDHRPLDATGYPDLNGNLPTLPSLDYFCGVVPGAVFSNFGKMLQLEGPAGIRMHRLKKEGLAWIPTIGNLLTLQAFGICMALNFYLTDGAPQAILMLAPLLLLLSQDGLLFQRMGERERYFPPLLAVMGYLSVLSGAEVLQTAFVAGLWEDTVRELVLLAAALPLNLMCLHFSWYHKHVPAATLVVLALVAVAPMALSFHDSTRYLACSGLLLAMIQFLSMRRFQHIAMSIL